MRERTSYPVSVGITPTPPLRMAETASSARHTSEPSDSSTVYATSCCRFVREASILAWIDRGAALGEVWIDRDAAAGSERPVHMSIVGSILAVRKRRVEPASHEFEI